MKSPNRATDYSAENANNDSPDATDAATHGASNYANEMSSQIIVEERCRRRPSNLAA